MEHKLINGLCFLLFSVDLAGLMPKAGMGGGDSLDSDFGTMADGPLAEDLGQSLVFTNSHHNGRVATHSYAHATANSYAHAASSGGSSASATYAHAALVHSVFSVILCVCVRAYTYIIWL